MLSRPAPPTPAARATRPRLRARRGSVIPLVCFLLVTLLGGVALALDLGRLNVSATEAQAAADAAALAGARALQTNPSTASSGVPAAVNNLAASNKVTDAPGAVPASEIVATDYSETRKTSTAGSFPTASAVRVGVAARAKYILGNAVSSFRPTVTRRSTAWIANVNGLQCVLPISVPYSTMYKQTVKGNGGGPNRDAPTYTQVDLRNVYDQDLPTRSLMLLPWGSTPPTSLPYDGFWTPIDYTGGNSGTDVQTWASGSSCSTATAQVGQTISAYQNAYQPWPGSGNPPNTPSSTYWAQIGAGLNSICFFVDGDARCKMSAGSTYIAPTLRFMFTDDVAGTGSDRPGNGNPASLPYAQQRVRMVALTRMICYWRTTNDLCDNITNYLPRFSTPGNKKAGPGYPAGSMLLLLTPIKDITLGSDVTLGDSISFTQRLVLVK